MTAKEALLHPWMQTTVEVDLLPNVRKNFNPKRTFKKAIIAAMAVRETTEQSLKQ
jgi:hypothetical protein